MQATAKEFPPKAGPPRAEKTRSPIVVVMGHVDHGKTTLLDYIRKTSIASREAGGITQAVGAYEIEHRPAHSTDAQGAPSVRKITFIDTPGHEAFATMRSAGAEVADVAILVVAADEGVKSQTKEDIVVLERTKTPFIVALTKIDKKEANLEKTKNDLTAAGVLLEGYGGQVSYHGVSSKTGEGVNDLLDLILLAADLEHVSYDPEANASGFILEAKLDHRRGFEVTAILKNGTLKTGEFIATETAKGKVKILENFLGQRVLNLEPSAPAIIIGFEKLPKVGETFTTSERETRAASAGNAPSSIPERPAVGTTQTAGDAMKLIIKARDLGSLEALSLTIRTINPEKRPIVLGESVGDISDGDVKTAIAMNAVIIGFKVRVNQAAKTLAEANRIVIVTSEIIYELVKALEETLRGSGAAEIVGTLDVLAVFNQTKAEKQLVGGRVGKGTFRNKATFDIERTNALIGRGRVLNLQSQKKDAQQVAEGSEAGLLASSDILIQVGDRLIIRK